MQKHGKYVGKWCGMMQYPGINNSEMNLLPLKSGGIRGGSNDVHGKEEHLYREYQLGKSCEFS